MSTNETSNEESSMEVSDNGEPTTDLTEHRSYNLVLKMVLWGESREDIYRRLIVNSVPQEMADQLYALAREDRIRTIRSDCFHDLMTGLGLIAAAVVAFCGCWYGLGFIPKILLYGCFAALGFGSWKFIDGFISYLMAPSKTGSVSGDA